MTARLTKSQEVDVTLARDTLTADAEGGPAAVLARTHTVSGPPPSLEAGDPYPYAYGAARHHVAALLQVVDELTAEPEAS